MEKRVIICFLVVSSKCVRQSRSGSEEKSPHTLAGN
jgi:hypothetical protein